MTLNTSQCHRNLRNARRNHLFLQTFHAPPVIHSEAAHFAGNPCRLPGSLRLLRFKTRNSCNFVKSVRLIDPANPVWEIGPLDSFLGHSCFVMGHSQRYGISTNPTELLYLERKHFSGTKSRLFWRNSFISP